MARCNLALLREAIEFIGADGGDEFQVAGLEGAEDGPGGLVRARELHPDVILLDVLMPRVDGWSVL